MKKTLSLTISIFLLAISCQSPNNSSAVLSTGIDTKYEQPINDLIDFFNKNAYNTELSTYLSELDNSGKILSDKVFNVALSRLIYGLSYASQLNNLNLEKAENAYRFQLANLTSKDSIGSYFNSFYDIENLVSDSSYILDVWQQAYGLCGMVELYRNKPNDNLLSSIHLFHNSFTDRFHDTVNRGFHSNYNQHSGQVSGSKTLQSLLYPITSYMENLWLCDTTNRPKYELYLKENLEIAYQKAWNEKLGWVNIKFDDFWNNCEHESVEKPCFTVTPGHNFQLASMFLRTKNWPFLSEIEKEKYKNLGIEILEITLKKAFFIGCLCCGK